MSDLSPIGQHLDLIKADHAGAKRLGVIYNPGEANSVTLVELSRRRRRRAGSTIVEAPAPRSADVLPAAQSLVGKVDAIYVPTDNTVVTALEAMVKVGTDNQLPVFAGDTNSVPRGAIAALGFNYYDVGRQTGKIVAARAARARSPATSRSRACEITELYVNPGAGRGDGRDHPAGRAAARQDRGRVNRRRADAAPDAAQRGAGSMSQIALLGALEIGLVYGLVALGVFLSFRVLSFPDLTVDGSFPLGAAVAASAIVGGIDPYLATGLRDRRRRARRAGHRLAQRALPDPAPARQHPDHDRAVLDQPAHHGPAQHRAAHRADGAHARSRAWASPAWCSSRCSSALVVLAVAALLARFLRERLRPRACARPAPIRAWRAPRASRPARTICVGMALSNALVALAGALFAQTNGFADITIGTGTIVVGLAAVIIGETILPARRIGLAVLACVLGSILYRLAVAAGAQRRLARPRGLGPQPGHRGAGRPRADPAGRAQPLQALRGASRPGMIEVARPRASPSTAARCSRPGRCAASTSPSRRASSSP